MAFLSQQIIESIGFKSLGNNVKISERAVFYRPEKISIGNHVRIDDFCVLSNHIIIHDHVHVALYSCLLSGSNSVIELHDYSGVAFRSLLFSVSDDYSGLAMTNPTIPDQYRSMTEASVIIEKHGLLGAGSIVMPGVTIAEGTSIGASSLVIKTTKPWKIYFGTPARIVGERSQKILQLERSLKEDEMV